MDLFSFHPGETFVTQFIIPYNINDVKAVVLSFRDKERVVYEAMTTSIKAENDSTGEPVRVGYLFTQGESLLFKEKSKYKLQLNIYGPNSSRVASREINVVTKEQQIWNSGMQRDSSILETTYGTYITQGVSSGGSSSRFDYNALINKPMLNGVELTGDRTLPVSITTEQIDQIVSESEEP